MSRGASADVVVIGGGPAGSVCAARLARRGLSVTVLEKTVFPRFHLGESLLPQSLVILDELGVLDAMKERFIWKYGARFHDDVNGRKDRFAFEAAWKAEHKHAFQVPRDEFDTLLLDHARACGAVVRFRSNVTRIVHDERGRAAGVEVSEEGGVPYRIEARFVVDASGRDIFTARGGATEKIDGLDQTALFAHYENIPRPAGDLAGDIDIVLFASGEPKRPNWFWVIPFKDGRTSVGAVVSRAWMRERRATLGASTAALFDAAVAEAPTVRDLLANADRAWPEVQATADFSYRVGRTIGDGWLAIGDAGGFIDPLFSTGAHIAMSGGATAADAISEALARPLDEPAILEAWRKHLRAGAETFILAVRAFYAGPLVEYLFAEDKHAALRRSITSLLAGDVFTDAIWIRDARARLNDMLAGSGDPPQAHS